MIRRLLFVLAVVLVPGLCATPALAERRAALLLGVDGYVHLRPLANPINDTAVLRPVLEGLGFEVVVETDRDLRRMRRALEDFVADAAGADLALVFFAGHGVEIAGRNHLLPADARAQDTRTLTASALQLEEVVAAARAVAPNVLILLDACRDDPFGLGAAEAQALAEGRGAAALGPSGAVPGLRLMGRSEGVVYAFAAAPGETAADGAGANSPFTEALVRHLATDGVDVRSALLLVQQDVYDRSRGAQLPYVESGLPRPVFLARPAADLPERDRLLLAMAELSPDLRAQVERAAATHDTPLAPLYAALLEGDLAAMGWADREARLTEAATAHRTTRERLLGLEAADWRVRDLRTEAEALLERGERQGALAKLEAAIAIDAGAAETGLAVAVERRISEGHTRLARAALHAAAFAYGAARVDYAAAEALYARAAALAMADGRAAPRAALDGQSMALTASGDLALVSGDTAAALAAFRAWQRAAADRADRAPDDPERLRDLAGSHNRLGLIHAWRGDLAAAQEEFVAGLDLRERLVALDPDDPGRLGDLAVAQGALGDVLEALGDTAGASDAFARSRAIAERLAAQQPEVAAWQVTLAMSHIRIGDLLLAGGDPVQAAAAHAAGRAIFAALAAREPDSVLWTRLVAVAETRAGDSLMAQGALAEAQKAHVRALAANRELADRDPENAMLQHDLSVAHDRLGDLHLALGHVDAALGAYRESLAIRTWLVALDPAHTGWRRDLSVAHNLLGDALEAAGELAGAEASYRTGLAVIAGLVASDPANMGWQRDLTVSLERLGDVLRARGDVAAAAEIYRERHAILQRLAAMFPESVPARLALVANLRRLAETGQQPRTNLTEAIALLEALAAEGRLPAAQSGWAPFLRDALTALPPD